jgi:hypothetical protein
MSDIASCLVTDTVDPDPDNGLSLRTRALAIIGLAAAAWVPVLLPIYLIFLR